MDFTDSQIERYSRHIILPEVGGKGQKKLARAKVLIVGAGGLGSPAALYLAAAGVGTIGLVDGDVVDLSNLQRQILHSTDTIGKSKVESGRAMLTALNPDVHVTTDRATEAVPLAVPAAGNVADALFHGGAAAAALLHRLATGGPR